MADLNRIKVVLAEKKISNKSLAEHLNKREETISRWCQNKQQPSIEDLNKIAEFLILDIRDLLNPSDWSGSKGEVFKK
ncbi:helix-turn-helix transcriptional regulator [Pedobacter sp. Leaf176]|uniref:helix-turn-helix transcriptional regulator n=1 Tax=Pedobacter sp. Leaf176 TaxID=1736286 RepID=UPI0006F9E6BF|nr:helix-turn-helix transcriptional regulator [Pedobacter sp. Leaf176]KQR65334.1 XRE family transcriptional regulator [Pedobacter sp. Leaf176]